MYFEHRAFWLAKDAAAPNEYQDASAADGEYSIAAVADGVSSTLFASSWARLLAQGIVDDPPTPNDGQQFAAWLATLRRLWAEPIDADGLAWHQKPKFAEGAAATLLWVYVDTDDAGNYWYLSYAIGDCCLFHVRGRQVLRSFPFDQSGDFDERPQVVRSVASRADDALPLVMLEDTCQVGDLLVLCTDAVAVWALQQLEAGSSPNWHDYWTLTQPGWEFAIDKLRTTNQIRYDDSTLLMLKITDHDKTASAPRSTTSLGDQVRNLFGRLTGNE